jgi:hypothetical protein
LPEDSDAIATAFKEIRAKDFRNTATTFALFLNDKLASLDSTGATSLAPLATFVPVPNTKVSLPGHATDDEAFAPGAAGLSDCQLDIGFASFTVPLAQGDVEIPYTIISDLQNKGRVFRLRLAEPLPGVPAVPDEVCIYRFSFQELSHDQFAAAKARFISALKAYRGAVTAADASLPNNAPPSFVPSHPSPRRHKASIATTARDERLSGMSQALPDLPEQAQESFTSPAPASPVRVSPRRASASSLLREALATPPTAAPQRPAPRAIPLSPQLGTKRRRSGAIPTDLPAASSFDLKSLLGSVTAADEQFKATVADLKREAAAFEKQQESQRRKMVAEHTRALDRLRADVAEAKDVIDKLVARMADQIRDATTKISENQQQAAELKSRVASDSHRLLAAQRDAAREKQRELADRFAEVSAMRRKSRQSVADQVGQITKLLSLLQDVADIDDDVDY